MARNIRTVGVIGLGTMGAGIVEVFARAGIDVVGVEHNEDALIRGRGHVEHSTARAVSRGKLTADEQAEIFARIRFTTTLEDLAEVDLAIEAVPEHLELKQEIFSTLDKVCGPDAILATNTSSLSVTEISVATSRPAQVVGMHFFNPAPVLRFVEVVRTVVTDPGVVDDVAALARRLGKTPVVVGDKAGFIANALLFGYLNSAVAMYESRYASREDIDTAMKLGCRLPMGPLALLDLIGLDTAYEILETMYGESRSRVHAPTPILKQMVTAGLKGRKTGRGFYTYEAPDSPVVVADALTPDGDGWVGTPRPVERVGVVGAGTMATGILEVFARAGYDVTLASRGDAQSASACAAVERSMDSAVQRGKLTTTDRDAAMRRIRFTSRLDDLADRDLVVEAVVEDLAVKSDLFAKLGQLCRPGVVLATTTDSLPVIDLAVASGRPADVVGLHFFVPAPVMQLVELVHTVSSSDDAVATADAVARRLGKSVIACGDRAGFVVSALLFPYLNDAVRMLQVQYASADDIDTAMKVGCGYPMGPFELLDTIGLDVALAIQRRLFAEFREPSYAPAPLLEQLVTAGYLGRKTGRGFRVYEE
jgi:3-hydroxybutyryl-CoA dehydrogenase